MDKDEDNKAKNNKDKLGQATLEFQVKVSFLFLMDLNTNFHWSSYQIVCQEFKGQNKFCSKEACLYKKKFRVNSKLT